MVCQVLLLWQQIIPTLSVGIQEILQRSVHSMVKNRLIKHIYDSFGRMCRCSLFIINANQV